MQTSSGYDGSVKIHSATVLLPASLLVTSSEHSLFCDSEQLTSSVHTSRAHIHSEQYKIKLLGTRKKAALATAHLPSNQAKAWDSFNGSVRWHCDRRPPGLASSSLEAFRKHDDNGKVEASDNKQDDLVCRDRRKRVLILMSDTGGGHRASADAIKTTFELEYGDKYQVRPISNAVLYQTQCQFYFLYV